MNFQIKNILNKIEGGVQNLKKGVRVADEIQRANQLNAEGGLGYGQSILDPRFKKEVAAQGINIKETPAQFLGAYASRLVVDAANDGTRTYWWRYNHPLAVAQKGVEAGVRQIDSPTARAAAALAVAVPSISAAGTYNLLNPGELFRPTGYAQTYSEPGTEDRRQTSQPAQELVERFFMGRTGEPLKYETAKQDIPDLTAQRYANYQNFLYNEKGLLGLGIVKATSENMQGYPEARMLGFPVTIPMAGGFAAGSLAARQAMVQSRTATPEGKSVTKYYGGRKGAARGIAGGFLGSVGGVLAGNLINEVIATANRPKLQELNEYQPSV
jgi:hypothetical protein